MTAVRPIDLRPAARRLAILLTLIGDDQLKDPTPCGDYTLGDLIDHVGGFAQVFAAAARKDLGELTASAPAPDGDQLGDAWRSRITAQLIALGEAWCEPAAWTGTTEAGGAESSGDTAGRLVCNELVVHGWDVARASGQEFTCDPPTLRACWEFAVATTPTDPPEGGGPFGVPVDVPVDASLIDRLVGLRGRDPHWIAT